MNTYIKSCISTLLILFSLSAKSQQFGGNPGYIKWMQLNSDAVRVIFPKGDDSIAQRIANIIGSLDSTNLRTIGSRRRKINIVLQDYTTISNAYVGLGPYRSEFLLTPEQNSFSQGSIPWPDQLAIHEYRHVQQYNNFNVGISKVLRILFGQEGQALANDGAIPNWFFEGDAVYNETFASEQGRGRLPYFFKDYKSIWNARERYSYMKLRNGSYKDFTPDHYALGYMLVSYGYQKYGDDFWLHVTQDAAGYKGLFYPFQNAVKRYAGISFTQFRSEAFRFFKSQLAAATPNTEISKNKEFNDQEFPEFVNDSTLVYIRSTYKKVPSFVLVKNGTEKIIRVRDGSIDPQFSYHNGNIVYAAYQPDKRWGYKDYSDIKLLNINSGKERNITSHSKYFSPDIDKDGTKIIAVKAEGSSINTLDLIDVKNGSVLTELENTHKYIYTYPKFINDSLITAAIRNSQGQMSLCIINIKSKSEKLLTPFTYNVIGFPKVKNDTIYFTSSINKNDELMAVTLSNNNLYTLSLKTNGSDIGRYQPAIYNNQFAYTTFTDKGFKIRTISADQIQWSIEAPTENNNLSDFGISGVNKQKDLLSNIIAKRYPIKKYSKATHILNFHSIEPVINDPVYTLNIIGENILNTFQSQIALSYDRNEGYKKGAFSLVYAGLYPYLTGGISYTIDRSALLQNHLIHWNETETFGGISLPLNLSKGRSLTFFNAGSEFTYNNTVYQQGVKPHSISYTYLNNFLTLSNQSEQAKQNIYPRYAQSIRIGFQNTLSQFTGHQLTIQGNLYLPGLLINHNLIFNAAFLLKDTLHEISFSSGFPFSRGYTAFNFHQMFKYGINYHMPILYPDAGIANIVYFLRLRTNLFYDNTRIMDYFKNNEAFNKSFKSIGGELFFDTKWWNQAPVSFGIRYSHLLDADYFGNHSKNYWEIVLPLNIFHN